MYICIKLRFHASPGECRYLFESDEQRFRVSDVTSCVAVFRFDHACSNTSSKVNRKTSFLAIKIGYTVKVTKVTMLEYYSIEAKTDCHT